MKVNELKQAIYDTSANISDLITVKKYISANEKIRIAKSVLDFSISYDRGFVKFDSYAKHLAFVFEVIEAHTSLRFADDWTERMYEYDLLCESDMLDAIIDTFRKDYEESLLVLDMMYSDMLTDNSIEASVSKLATSIAENLDVFVGAIADKLESFDVEKIIPKDLDLDKLKGLLNNFK